MSDDLDWSETKSEDMFQDLMMRAAEITAMYSGIDDIPVQVRGTENSAC